MEKNDNKAMMGLNLYLISLTSPFFPCKSLIFLMNQREYNTNLDIPNIYTCNECNLESIEMFFFSFLEKRKDLQAIELLIKTLLLARAIFHAFTMSVSNKTEMKQKAPTTGKHKKRKTKPVTSPCTLRTEP